MASSYFRDLPPYMGNDPYVYLCFHEQDAKAVRPLLEALAQRRCRVWYSMGYTIESDQHNERTARAKGAALMICYLTPRAANNEQIKSNLGYYQETGKPVICVETEGCTEQSGVSLMLKEHVRRLPRAAGESVESLVSALLRTEGFTQQLLAENDTVWQLFLQKRKSRRLALFTLSFAVLALAVAFFYSLSMGYFNPQPRYADEITISDAVIQRAARNALSQDGTASLTQRGLNSITTLRLDETPSSFDELSLFPALTRLEIPQSSVQAATEKLLGADYTIVVYPEATHE